MSPDPVPSRSPISTPTDIQWEEAGMGVTPLTIESP